MVTIMHILSTYHSDFNPLTRDRHISSSVNVMSRITQEMSWANEIIITTMISSWGLNKYILVLQMFPQNTWRGENNINKHDKSLVLTCLKTKNQKQIYFWILPFHIFFCLQDTTIFLVSRFRKKKLSVYSKYLLERPGKNRQGESVIVTLNFNEKACNT